MAVPASGVTVPARPPPRPFNGANLSLEQNPFEVSLSQSSSNTNASGAPSPTLSPLSDFAEFAQEDSNSFPWGFPATFSNAGSLQAWPLLPAMLLSPCQVGGAAGAGDANSTRDHVDASSFSFSTSLTTGLGRTGLTPLFGGPTSFPSHSPKTAEFLAMVTDSGAGEDSPVTDPAYQPKVDSDPMNAQKPAAVETYGHFLLSQAHEVLIERNEQQQAQVQADAAAAASITRRAPQRRSSNMSAATINVPTKGHSKRKRDDTTILTPTGSADSAKRARRSIHDTTITPAATAAASGLFLLSQAHQELIEHEEQHQAQTRATAAVAPDPASVTASGPLRKLPTNQSAAPKFSAISNEEQRLHQEAEEQTRQHGDSEEQRLDFARREPSIRPKSDFLDAISLSPVVGDFSHSPSTSKGSPVLEGIHSPPSKGVVALPSKEIQSAKAVAQHFLVDRGAVLAYWLCLDQEDRRSLVEADRDAALSKLRNQYAKTGCNCADCLQTRSRVEMEIGLLYEVFTDDLEEPVSQFEDAQSSSSQDLSTSSNTRGFDTYPTIRMATTQLKSNLSHPTYEFTTLGPAFTSTSDIVTVAEDTLNNDSTRLPLLFETLADVQSDCKVSGHDAGLDLVPLKKKWPIAMKNMERYGGLCIFATRTLERRVLSAYAKHLAFEVRQVRLQAPRNLRSVGGVRNLSLESAMLSGIIPFKQGEIVIDRSYPINTSGASCDLLCGYHPQFGKVAMKRSRFDTASPRGLTHFLREVRVWQGLQHEHLLPLLGILIGDDISLISPFVDNGSLPNFLLKHPNTDRERLTLELASALDYLHQKNTIHGDVKGGNVLVSSEAKILLCDFGLAKMTDTVTASSLAGKGSLRWQAPELMGEKATKTCKSDVWAFAMTVYEMLSGKLPFEIYTATGPIVAAVYVNDERPAKEPASSPTGYSYQHLWNTVERCWTKSPEYRPSMAEVVASLRSMRLSLH